MKVVWSPRAALDLEELTDYIAADSTDAALRVANRIYKQVTQLEVSHLTGRIGTVEGTRELIFHAWPYIAVYRGRRSSPHLTHSTCGSTLAVASRFYPALATAVHYPHVVTLPPRRKPRRSAH